jgi:acyl carrier protein
LSELLELVSAIDEELLYLFSTSKEDYVKTGSNWEYRIEKKRKELAGTVGVAGFLKSVLKKDSDPVQSNSTFKPEELGMDDDPSSPTKKRNRKN